MTKKRENEIVDMIESAIERHQDYIGRTQLTDNPQIQDVRNMKLGKLTAMQAILDCFRGCDICMRVESKGVINA